MEKIINLTPHDIRLVDDLGEAIMVLPKAVTPARVSSSSHVVATINGITVEETVFGEVVDLPEMKDGVFYVVSRLVFTAANARADLLVPGQQVRNADGMVVGCKSFAR